MDMRKTIVTIAAVAVTTASQGVELVRTDARWTVSNAHYCASFKPSAGYRLGWVKYGKREWSVAGGFVVGYDGQSEKFIGRAHAAQRIVGQDGAKGEVVENAPNKVVLRFSWPLPCGGKAVQTVSFDDSPVVRYVQDVDWKQPLGDAIFELNTLQANARKTLFYPESRAFTGVWNNGNWSALPRWKYMHDGAFGCGVVAADGTGWENFVFAARTPAKGWGARNFINLKHEYLANEPVPNRKSMRFSLVLSGDLATAVAAARGELSGAPAVQLCDIEPDRVYCRKGGENALTTTLVNNTAEARTVKVAVELASGFDDVRRVSEEVLELKPGEMRVYRKGYSFADRPDFEWGLAVRVRVSDANTGELLDCRSDVTSVANRGFNASGVGITNAGTTKQDGAEAAWADVFRRQYIGMVEYYAWSPSTWDPERKMGQAPKVDEWWPTSDSQTGYINMITKKFLKTLIEEFHKRGVDAYDWITGLCNYRQAVAHPDKFQYCRNGQLAIYAGRVWKPEENKLLKVPTRFAVAKIAPYTVEDAIDWGEQTVESIEMFGWDGCRWDWGWTPCAPNDPLYMAELLLDKTKFEWFDSKGVSCFEKYPDPDATGTECLRAWRDTIAKKHPEFTYSANIHATDSAFKSMPRYMAETCRDGLALLEYLIPGGAGDKLRTFEKWGSQLANDNQNVRRCGSHSEVGHISTFCAGSVGGQLTRYVCHAAGSKWWGGPGDMRYWGAKHRSLPFAIRFSEYFWSLDLMSVPAADLPSKVEVVGDRLFWKPFVYERVSDGVRELVVHVVNVDPGLYMIVKHPDVKAVKDLKVRVKPAPGEKSVEAWGLVPGDEPTAVRLAGGGGEFTLPRLEEAAALVFRFSK